jgi:hypothetical protein
MAYENNGTARSLYFTVNKQVGGNDVIGYPHTYNGQNSWGDILYPTLTDNQVRQLSDGAFAARYAAFVAYVEGIESGLDFATDIFGNGATKYDPSNCGITTTTTAGVPPVYAFSIKYGKYPVDVCNGIDAVVYTDTQLPIAGTTLYKNAALTQKWNTINGEHIRLVSPVIYGTKAIEVNLSTGKITSVTIFDCSGVTPVCVQISEQLGWGGTPAMACSAVRDTYYGNSTSFETTTTISASPSCLVTLGGYYSNGTIWKYTSDGVNFISSGTC